MTHGTPNEARLVAYLLGETGPDERARIEERYMSDPDFLAEVQAVERDLIDLYVQGELTNRTAFETHFLASPARREKVEFAQALMQSSTRATSDRQRPSPRHRPWQLAAAAALVLVTGGWLLISSRAPENPQNAVAGRQRPAGNAGGPEGSRTPPAVAPVDGAPIPRPPETALRVVTLMLAPTLTRNNDVTPTLVVTGAAEVRFQLELEAVGHDSYRAVIRTADGAEIWRQDRLTSQSLNDRQTVTVTVPANRFGSDDYTITLSGVTRSGEAEEVGGYYVRARGRP